MKVSDTPLFRKSHLILSIPSFLWESSTIYSFIQKKAVLWDNVLCSNCSVVCAKNSSKNTCLKQSIFSAAEEVATLLRMDSFRYILIGKCIFILQTYRAAMIAIKFHNPWENIFFRISLSLLVKLAPLRRLIFVEINFRVDWFWLTSRFFASRYKLASTKFFLIFLSAKINP